MTRVRLHMVVRVLLVVVAMLVVAYPVVAGIGYTVKCANCNFQSSLTLGGGQTVVNVATGYCGKCEKFVMIWYDHTNTSEENAKKLETPLGEVFCADSGTWLTIYACPECGGPFSAIPPQAFGTENNPKTIGCPKCGKITLVGTPKRRID